MANLWQEDLFQEDGHLTDRTLLVFAHGEKDGSPVEFDELQRLEIAEHLSFCDACILRYTELMTEEAPLLAPSELTAAAVIRDLEKRERQSSLSKWTSMVAAAGFAIFFWVAGVFSPNLADLDMGFLTGIVNGATAFCEQTVEISTEITDSMGNWIEKLNWRGELSHGKK